MCSPHPSLFPGLRLAYTAAQPIIDPLPIFQPGPMCSPPPAGSCQENIHLSFLVAQEKLILRIPHISWPKSSNSQKFIPWPRKCSFWGSILFWTEGVNFEKPYFWRGMWMPRKTIISQQNTYSCVRRNSLTTLMPFRIKWPKTIKKTSCFIQYFINFLHSLNVVSLKVC